MNSQFKVPQIEAHSVPFEDDGPSLAEQLRRVYAMVVRRWPIMLGSVAVLLALAVVWLLQTTAIYTATTQLLIDPRKERVLREEAVVGDLALDASSIATEVALVQSFSVARRVAEKLDLENNARFSPPGGSFNFIGWILGFLPQMFSAPDGGQEERAGDTPSLTPRQLSIIKAVQSGISVRREGPTYFIEISFSHRDAKLAAELANAVAESYLVEQLEARYQGARRAATWLSERVGALRGQLEASERALAEHRGKHNLVTAQAGTLAEQQATEINAQLVAARSLTVDKRAQYEQAQRILDGGAGIESVGAVVNAPAIVGLRTQAAELGRQEAELLTRYGPEHPAVVKLRAERGDIRRQISQEVARVVQTLKTDYDFALRKEQSLEASLRELTGANSNDQAVIRLRDLERDVQANRVLYESLLTRFKEAEQQTSLQTAESRVIAPAFAPNDPSHPRKGLTLILAVLVGLAMGLGAGFLLEQLESGFATVEQLEQATQLPVLAIVPRLETRERAVDGRTVSIPEYVALKPLSRFGESIRSVRVSALMSDIDRPPKLILVTSSVPAEGKSTVVQSLAYSAASSNQRVLLIDCDLRHPSTSKCFKAHEGPGLTDLLMGHASAEQVFVRGPLPNLTVLPAGTTTRHPPDILGSERLRALLASVCESYDVVMLDAPPLSPVIDSSILSKLADKVIYVVNWRQTPRDLVLRSLQGIDDPRQKIAGLVLNNAQLRLMSSYSSYYSYYHKKYQKYYSS